VVVAASFVGVAEVVVVVAASFVGVAEVVAEEVVDAELLAEALGQVAAHHQAVCVLERRAWAKIQSVPQPEMI